MLHFRHCIWKKKKKRKKKKSITRSFSKITYNQLEGIRWTLFYCILWPVTNLGHGLQSISARNFHWGYQGNSKSNVQGRIKNAQMSWRNVWLAFWMCDERTAGWLQFSPGPGSHPMSLKIKPLSLMARRLYWLKPWDRIISLWLFYWLQDPWNNDYNMKPDRGLCLRE